MSVNLHCRAAVVATGCGFETSRGTCRKISRWSHFNGDDSEYGAPPPAESQQLEPERHFKRTGLRRSWNPLVWTGTGTGTGSRAPAATFSAAWTWTWTWTWTC